MELANFVLRNFITISERIFELLLFQEETFLNCAYMDTFEMGNGEEVYYQHFPYKKLVVKENINP